MKYNYVEKIRTKCPILADAMMLYGYKNVHELCKFEGLHATTVGNLINKKVSIYTPGGHYIADVLKIAELCGETPERIFGVETMNNAVPTRVIVADPGRISKSDRIVLWRILRSKLFEETCTILKYTFIDGMRPEVIAGVLNKDVHPWDREWTPLMVKHRIARAIAFIRDHKLLAEFLDR